MQQTIEDQAIKASLDGEWQLAVELNQQILTQTPQSIPALNRLAKAYSQLGNTAQALTCYEQVLQLDKFNSIAIKNCELLKKSPCQPIKGIKLITTDFIEEPGKTKTATLVRLGDAKLVSTLQPGQLVNLVIKNHWIAITTQDNEYIGALADNVSFPLKQQMNGGNQYQAVIRIASNNQVIVLIKETYRAPHYANTPSF